MSFQAASYYCVRLGFHPFAYKGLETGSRLEACHAVRQNDVSIIQLWYPYILTVDIFRNTEALSSLIFCSSRFADLL